MQSKAPTGSERGNLGGIGTQRVVERVGKGVKVVSQIQEGERPQGKIEERSIKGLRERRIIS